MTEIFLCTHTTGKMGLIVLLYIEINISVTHKLQIKPIFTVILHDSTSSSVISDSYIACDLRLSGPLLCPVYSLFIVCLKGLYSVEINILYLNENYEAELVYCPECTELLQTEARCVCHEPPKGPRNLSEILLHKSSVYPCTFVYLGPT